MMVTNIFFYKILFAAEILVAEFLYSFRLKHSSAFLPKAVLSAAFTILVAAVFYVPFERTWYSTIVFLTIFGVTVPLLKLCFNEPWVNIIFCAIASYTTQHFAFELANLLLTLISWVNSPLFGMYASDSFTLFEFNKVSVFYSAIYLACFFATYVAAYYVFCKRIRRDADMRVRSLTLTLLIGAGLLCNIVLHSVIIYQPFDRTNVLVSCMYNMMVCILLLCGQFALLQNKELKTELDVVRQLLYGKQERYEALKENIDIINMKCHDIRHQIREFSDRSAIGDDIVRDIQGAIKLYDGIMNTGNEALDVILTEKSMKAQAGGITLSVIADGKALSFLSDAEIYSLFGNAIDNAMEATGKISDPAKRFISINVQRTNGFVLVCVKNSYEGEIAFDRKGIPETTKENKLYHGYGIKSINYITEKHDGSMNLAAENGTFMISLLFPVPDAPSETRA